MTSAAFNKLLGRRLKSARLISGITSREQAATLIGISQGQYSNIELGQADMPTAVLIRAASTFCVSTDYLLGLSSEQLEGSEQSARAWLVNLAARQATGRLALAERYAKIESDNERLLSITADLIGTATDFLCAFERVIELNPEEFQDLKAGSALVESANAFRQAKYTAQLKL